jgi:hypothetical protein
VAVAVLLVALASVAFATPASAQWEYEDCEVGCMKCAGFLFFLKYCTLVDFEEGACNCGTDCFGEFGNMVCSCSLGGELCFGIIVEPI